MTFSNLLEVFEPLQAKRRENPNGLNQQEESTWRELRQQIEEALLRVEGTAPHYLVEVDRPGALDEVTVYVEMRPQDFSDKMSQIQQLRDRIDREINSITGIRARVELVEPKTLERSVGKAKRVIDRRHKRFLSLKRERLVSFPGSAGYPRIWFL